MNDDIVLQMTNSNNDYYKIGEYIISKYNINIDISEAKNIGKRLMVTYGYRKEEILNGNADNIIEFELNSKLRRNEEVKFVPIKTTKLKINKKAIIEVIASIVAITSVYSFVIKPTYNEIKEDNEVRESIGMMASEVGSDDYESKRGIVSQNTYVVNYDDKNFPVSAYHNDGIAQDIIKVCTSNPELFDLCLYNVYFDMNYNRLNNMDEVIKWLNKYSQDDNSLAFIQDKLFNCNIFLDYLMTKGIKDSNDKDYYQLVEDIKAYKEGNGYNSLNDEGQKRIEDLINEYKKNKDNLYDGYKDVLKQDEDIYGTRS